MRFLGSPPTRGRGLKLLIVGGCLRMEWVAPYTGARIETAAARDKSISRPGRPLHGGAD